MAGLPQRTNAVPIDWDPNAAAAPAARTPSTASTVSLQTPMSSVSSTASLPLSTASTQSGKSRRRKSKKNRGRRKSRRGGFTKGGIPHGKTCVFPDSSMASETRTFVPGELVCYMDPGNPTPKSATYVTVMNPYVHRIQQTIDDVEVYAPWHLVGKLVEETSGTGAAGNGVASGSSSSPLLARSNVGGRKRKITRRR